MDQHYPTFNAPQHPGQAPQGAPVPQQQGQADLLASLRGEVKRARILAAVGLTFGIVGTGLGIYAVTRPTPVAPPAPAVTVTAAAPQVAPARTTVAPAAKGTVGPAEQGTIVLGAPGNGNPVVDIYEDFQCPACASVETRLGPEADQLIAGGKTEVRYHMMSFLDRNLNNDSSVRAANGGFCANDQGKFNAWHDTLFAPANRPPQEGVGWTDAQLETFAQTSGVDVAAWKACVASGKHAADVTAADTLASQSGITGTPTYRLNGVDLNLQQVVNSGGLVAYVESHR